MTVSPTDLPPAAAASRDAVYQQWHEEMRYYRLYQQAVTFWASTVLLTLAGGALAFASAESRPCFGFFTRGALTAAPGVFALLAVFIIAYVHRRYDQLRAQREHLEPPWKYDLDRQGVHHLPKILNPTSAGILVIVLLGAIGCVAVWAATAPIVAVSR